MGDVTNDDGWDRVASGLKGEIEKQELTLRHIENEGDVAYRPVQKPFDGSPSLAATSSPASPTSRLPGRCLRPRARRREARA